MNNFGTLFLWALAACILFNGSFATKVQAQERQNTIKEENEGVKTAAPQQAFPAASAPITIPPGFQLIGNRYLRVVYENLEWDSAEKKCREMGGYLASFRNEEEINAIKPKLDYFVFWIGINDQDNEGHYLSVASQKPAPFLKWYDEEGQPSDKNHTQNCVYLLKGKMGDYYCNEELYFICQAEKDI